MITHKEYAKATGCSIIPGHMIRFEFEEIRDFLISKGYEVKVYSGLGSIKEKEPWDGSGEVRHTGKVFDDQCTTVIAVKPETELPLRVDDPDLLKHHMLSVFEKELKRKLLS